MSKRVREEFEAWWVMEMESHTYQHEDAHNMAWEGWQASRLAALEEAAKVCEGMACSEQSSYGAGRDHAAEEGARDIRALMGGDE